jgi:hypothetical protein
LGWNTDPNSVYPADPFAQAFLQKYQVSNEMYQGTDDSLSLNRSDMSGWKMERWVKLHLIDHIQINNDRTVTHNFQSQYDFNIPAIKVVTDQSGNIDYNKTNQTVFGNVYNAAFGNDYSEYWRLYTNSTALLISNNTVGSHSFFPGPELSKDFPNRSYFQGTLHYDWVIQQGNPNIQWGYGALDQEPPAFQWTVQNVIHNGKYILHVQPQSGVDTSVAIDITGPCGKQTYNQPLTTNLVITVLTAHC